MCLFTRSLLFTGHVSRFDTLHMSFSLSLCSLMQSYSRRFTVCSPPLHGHSGGSIILKRCRLALVLPWAVNIAVKFGVNLILLVSLSLMTGKIFSLLVLLLWNRIGFATWLCSGPSVVVLLHFWESC